MEDFEISIVNPNPVGGQQAGIPNYHVKVLHKPTGIYAVCMSERSQLKNREIAKQMVEYGLLAIGYKTND